MPLTPYTTGDEVRAAVGVTDEELSDATLGLDIYAMNLALELDAIRDNAGALVTAFTTIYGIAEGDRTLVQARLYAAVKLFAPYVVALQLETSAPLFTPKAITDGKAAVTRHSESPFNDAFAKVRQYYERFRQALEKRWAEYGSTTTTAPAAPTQFVISSPSTDPVTG